MTVAGMMERKLRVFLSSRQNEELNPYREWAAAEVARYDGFLTLVRFESVASATQTPEEIYNAGVQTSDVVLVVIGSDVSNAVRNEVATAIRCEVDLLAFVLPIERSAEAANLIETIKPKFAKEAPLDEKGFHEAVQAALNQWIVSRVATGTWQARDELLAERARASTERLRDLFAASGLHETLAAALASDPSVGDPEGFVPLQFGAFQGIVGPKGSGKSLTLERLYQKAIGRARDDVFAPIPVLLRAPDVTHGLEEAVRFEIGNLGSLSLNGVSLFLDSLDEVTEATADELARKASILVHTYQPSSSVVVAGRNVLPAHLQEYQVQQPALSLDMQQALLERIGNPEARRRRIAATAADALRRPLFLLVLATNEATLPVGASEDQIAELLFRKALTRTERAKAAAEPLKRLAAAILDTPSASAPADDFSDVEQLELLQTRLVTEENGALRIPLRLVTEYAAGLWLLDRGRDVVLSRISTDDRADRWRSAIAKYLRGLDDQSAEELLLDLALRDLVLALALAEADATPRSEPNPNSRKISLLRRADEVFEHAMPAIYENSISRYELSSTNGPEHIVRQVIDANERHIFTITSQLENADTRHAALLACKQFAMARIDEGLSARSFAITNMRAVDEARWNEARVVASAFDHSRIPVIPIAAVLRRINQIFDPPFSPPPPPGSRMIFVDGVRQTHVDLLQLRTVLQAKLDAGIEGYAAPFLVGDRDLDKWVWSRYSPDRLLEMRRDAVSNALDIYRQLVDLWFPGLARRLRRYLMLPARYREHVHYDGANEPVYSEYWTPLPNGSASEVLIEAGVPFDFPQIAVEMRELVDEYRPDVRERIQITATTGRMSSIMWERWPATDVAYEWLVRDLKEIGFTRQLRLSGRH
jgi:hypothetical protein